MGTLCHRIHFQETRFQEHLGHGDPFSGSPGSGGPVFREAQGCGDPMSGGPIFKRTRYHGDQFSAEPRVQALDGPLTPVGRSEPR